MTRCTWISRDHEGRPSCEHGPAYKQGGGAWACPKKAVERMVRYRANGKGRIVQARWNQSDSGRSSKALYELTRIRVS